jgi:hypothetical protein
MSKTKDIKGQSEVVKRCSPSLYDFWLPFGIFCFGHYVVCPPSLYDFWLLFDIFCQRGNQKP